MNLLPLPRKKISIFHFPQLLEEQKYCQIFFNRTVIVPFSFTQTFDMIEPRLLMIEKKLAFLFSTLKPCQVIDSFSNLKRGERYI